jgi:hypothetical protein
VCIPRSVCTFLEHVCVLECARVCSFEFNFFWVGLTTLAYVYADLVALDLGLG